MQNLRSYLRAKLMGSPRSYQRFQRVKYWVGNLFALRFCLIDLVYVWRYMYWGDESRMSPSQLHAKLLFYYHKIEKALSLPGKKRLFGLDVVPRVIHMLEVWESHGNNRHDPIYLGALSSLRAYKTLLDRGGLDPGRRIAPTVVRFLAQRDATTEERSTPIAVSFEHTDTAPDYAAFRTLCHARRSFRNFRDQAVDDIVVQRAIELAQLSPSVCNRQSCKVYVVREEALKKKVLSHQNGNAGFGYLAPVLMVIAADMRHFFGAIERHQPYIDSGLFAMSLLYAFQAQGLVSCCLNWCVTPTADTCVHRILSIPSSERIAMFMLVGYPPPVALVPRSPRKAITSVLIYK